MVDHTSFVVEQITTKLMCPFLRSFVCNSNLGPSHISVTNADWILNWGILALPCCDLLFFCIHGFDREVLMRGRYGRVSPPELVATSVWCVCSMLSLVRKRNGSPRPEVTVSSKFPGPSSRRKVCLQI